MRYHEDMNEDEKTKAAVRGIGIPKAHIYIRKGEEVDELIVSVSDYFSDEDEQCTVIATSLDDDAVLTGQESSKCAGTVEGLSLITCMKTVVFTVAKGSSTRIGITCRAVLQSVDIRPDSPKSWLEWK